VIVTAALVMLAAVALVALVGYVLARADRTSDTPTGDAMSPEWREEHERGRRDV
jgi:hypothetical protein